MMEKKVESYLNVSLFVNYVIDAKPEEEEVPTNNVYTSIGVNNFLQWFHDPSSLAIVEVTFQKSSVHTTKGVE